MAAKTPIEKGFARAVTAAMDSSLEKFATEQDLQLSLTFLVHPMLLSFQGFMDEFERNLLIW
jgi:hypothetical protein